MRRNRLANSLVTLGALGAGAAAAYALLVRPWHRRWGAADSEVRRALPGDDLVPGPRIRSTHAVTINAPASRVWPWIVQLGAGRGGFYSYPWLENLMVRLNLYNADYILPAYQTLKAGDVVPFEPGGGGPPVAAIEPGRYLLLGGRVDARSEGLFSLQGQAPGAYFAAGWLFYLDPVGLSATRLIERFQLDWDPGAKNWITYHLLVEPLGFYLERGLLLGIKRRAERAR